MSDAFPLSAQQQFHWETLRFRSLGRTIAGRDGPFISVRLSGGLDVARLRAALAELVERHESLRTTLTDVGPDPSQRVAAHIELPFSFVDLSSVAASHRDELARRVVAAERSAEFDLEAGPLWHCLVVELSPVAHVLALHFCHLVIDGVSLMSFFEQLAGLYEGKSVPRPTSQYRDYVAQSWPDADELERRLAYWRQALLPRSPRLAFPTDHAASPPALVSTTTLTFRSAHDSAQLRELGRAARVTPFMLYVAAYAIVLARTSGADRVVFGSSVVRLDLKADERMLGYFLDMALIPVGVRPKDRLGDLLARVRQSVLAGHEHAVPYLALARAINPQLDAQRPWPGMNLYDAWLRGRVFETVGEGDAALVASFGATKVSLFATTTGYGDLPQLDERQAEAFSRCYLPALYLDDAAGSSGYLEYNRAVFAPITAQQIARRVDGLLGWMASPDAMVDVAWNAVRKRDAPRLAR